MLVPAIVDYSVVNNSGDILIPRGSKASLEVIGLQRSSNVKGRDRITLKLHSVSSGGTRMYDVASSPVELKGASEGKRAARKILGGAGIGAAVGSIFGGGTGAAIGGAAGATTGGVVAGSGKTNLNVPAETLLRFSLEAPMRIHAHSRIR